MKTCGSLFLLAVLYVCINNSLSLLTQKHDKVVVCYAASWAHYRKADGKFQSKNLPAELCTHFIYAFAGLNTSSWTIRSLDPWRDIEDGIGDYKRMTDLRNKNPELKISLAIGGWNEGSKNYSDLAASPSSRKTFIASVVDYLKKYNFDGFDLDWEFPGKRGGAPYDKENFVALVKELKEAFKGPRLSLTAAISASKETIDVAYDIPEISKYLDYIHVMAYDYHGTWDLKALPNSPLRSNDELSVEDSVKHLLEKGAPANKLILGLPMYGRTFILSTKLNSTDASPIGQPALNKGFKGPYTNEDGFMGYNEICEELVENAESWRTGWDDFSSTPYAIKDDHVVVYDNPKSVKAKVELVTNLNLAGVMVWSIDTDDFRGKCASLHNDILDPVIGIDFPLLRTIHISLAKRDEDKMEDGTNLATRFSYNYGLFLLLLVISYA